MIAPEELSRKKNTLSGETNGAITHAKPITEDARIDHIGTPRLLTDSMKAGASRRAASTNSMREAVYRPEFRHDSTAVSTTKFMISAANGIPITSIAETYGESPSLVEFHGRIVASRKIEPTKNTRIRNTTEFVALTMPFSGSSDSAAAIVAISAPTIEKITMTMPENSAPKPLGKKPPCEVRFEKSRSRPGHSPRTNSVPSAMKATIAKTFTPANQYSNSP